MEQAGPAGKERSIEHDDSNITFMTSIFIRIAYRYTSGRPDYIQQQ